MLKRKMSVLPVISLVMTVFLSTLVYAEVLEETWVKAVPEDQYVSIAVKENAEGNYIAEVKIIFGSAGFRVNYVDEVVVTAARVMSDGKTSKSYMGEADIEEWTGPAAAVMTEKILTYNLGKPEDGVHQFTFRSDGFEKKCDFEVKASQEPKLIAIYGDLNDDTDVNSTDFTLIKRCIMERKYDPRADLNMDGSVDSTDLTLLKRFILKIIDSLPYIPYDDGVID